MGSRERFTDCRGNTWNLRISRSDVITIDDGDEMVFVPAASLGQLISSLQKLQPSSLAQDLPVMSDDHELPTDGNAATWERAAYYWWNCWRASRRLSGRKEA